MHDAAVRFEGVTRRFGRRTALHRLDLAIEAGSIVALVGRNGAGKTTALRLALGVLWPHEGSVRTLGLDTRRQGLAVRRRVTLLSEESVLYPWMRVREILGFTSRLVDRWDRDLERDLLRRLDLDPEARVGALSRGGRAKVSLILALCPRPEVLLLDDPTAGLDPLVRREVLEQLLASLPDDGVTVLYASHLVHDVERLADRILVLDEGRVRLDVSANALRREFHRTTAVFPDEAPALPEDSGAIHCAARGRVLSLVSRRPPSDLSSALRDLGAEQVEVEPVNLEDVLVACLQRPSVEDSDA